MADTNVGQVSLDLILNSKQFKTQLNSAVNNAVKGTSKNTSKLISGTFGKIGKIAAGAFAIGSIVKFGKACLDLGSNLAEVQNVVDVAFGDMSGEIDKFASTAITKFGLSETVAKKYAGTFGAMATSFGFTTEEAVQMSKTLTGLTGDVSSFYNLNSDEAYTKLKAVFTGETESLKELGVVMTQSALDQYALQKGYGKTTNAMSEQEKVALRYSFVQDKLQKATGDFIRTQDGWANQTRVLKLQWDSFKASIGQGLINILTPIIKMINLLMTKLVQLAGLFKSFTDKLFGNAGKTTSAVASDMYELASNTENVGDTATDTAKKIKKSIMGFDQLNTLSDNSYASSGGAGGGNIDIPSIDTETSDKQLDKTTKKTSVLVEKLKELANLFKKGLKIGLSDANLDKTKKSVSEIGKSLKNIFTDKNVLNGADNFANRVILSFGKITGAAANIGITVSELIVGGIESFLSTKGNRIKQFFVNMFDIKGEVAEIQGNFAAALGEIFSSFRSTTAKELLGNIIGIFSEVGMTVAELSSKLGRDIIDGITKPIIDNKTKFKKAFDGIISVLNDISGTINDVLSDIGDSFNNVYDNHIHPLFVSLRDGLSDTVSKFLDMWNTHIQPILTKMGDKLSELLNNNIKPFLTKVGEFIGKIADLIKEVWEEPIKPIVDWIIKYVVPVVGDVLKTLWDLLMDIFGWIFDTLGNLMTSLGGVIDFITGVFTGDWSKAWDGIKNIFVGIFDIILGLFGTNCEEIGNFFGNLGTKLKQIASDAMNGIKNFFVDGFNALVNLIKKPINSIISFINKMIDGLNTISIDVPDWVPALGGKQFGFSIPHIPALANGGYVAANTPQLALVGDNKREGEIIAPESKITETVAKAMTPILLSIQQLITTLANNKADAGDITIPVILDGNILDTVIVTANNRKALRTGGR